MCGICGLFTTEAGACADPGARRALTTMSTWMERRGPDDAGEWVDAAGHAALAFRRLSILDLSPTGHQPMVSASGRSVLVFNGEIYNFRELRSELEGHGHSFRSSGDSEVLLAALEQWDLDVLPRLAGMFAFAWYQPAERRLTLARDRAGIKPLYYSWSEDRRSWAFGSQYNQVLALPWQDSPGDLRHESLGLYLRLSHLPAPWTLHQRTAQLRPGHWLRLDAGGKVEEGAFWTLPANPAHDLNGEDGDLLTAALEKSVRRHRLADVPLGVFLSGGVDSALITSLARKQTTEPLMAFTLGNPGWNQDEEPMARRFADHLGVDHRVLRLSATDWPVVLAEVLAAQHEPFADFSIVPTLLISRFARHEVKVVLSGDGGDELFFGYERPRSLLKDGWAFSWPHGIRRGLYYAGRLGVGPRRSDVICFPTPGDYYLAVNSRLSARDLVAIAPQASCLPEDFDLYDATGVDGDERRLAHFSRRAEYHGQLQRCLKKVDMASMFHGLEVRVPFLDPEVLDLSLRFDPMASLGEGDRKRLLRRQLTRHVPASMIDRRKLGFSIPLKELLRQELRPWAEELLFDGELFPSLLRRPAVEDLWQRHQEGGEDHKWALWSLLCLQGWAVRQRQLGLVI